jgi:hypothetical protein
MLARLEVPEMRWNGRLSLILAGVAFAWCAGCSDAPASNPAPGASPGPTPDTSPPKVQLATAPYSAVSGTHTLDATWTDDRGVTKVLALVDGQPAGEVALASRTFDSSKAAPGAHKLSLEASDAAGNKGRSNEVTVVLAGKGAFLPFTDGWAKGTLPGWAGLDVAVAHDAESVDHEKAHVEMPAGVVRVMAFFHWKQDTAWSLGFDIGTGGCPDDGVALASWEQAASEALSTSSHPQAPAGDLPTGTWFAHVRFNDGLEHKGQTLHLNALWLALPN